MVCNMLSLSIFSSSKSVSLAVSKEKKIIKFIEKNDNQVNKSNILLILIQNVLKEYELSLFKNIIFSRGPGGFTSIRSLIAISQGLCLNSNINLLSVTTFELFLCQLMPKKGVTLICFKESRRDFYYQFYIPVMFHFITIPFSSNYYHLISVYPFWYIYIDSLFFFSYCSIMFIQFTFYL